MKSKSHSHFIWENIPVTQSEWEAVMGENPSYFKKGGDHPVEQVSWNKVQEFIKKLNSRDEYRYRLPTEAEWEYACRAGSEREYYHGDDASELSLYAVYNKGSERRPFTRGEQRAKRLAPVRYAGQRMGMGRGLV